jgi:protocatechuate 3,4-dioxygenase beta subunit
LLRRSLLFAGLACLAPPVLAQCRRTPTDALGPYYVPVSGLQPDLCLRDKTPGIIVSGRVIAFPECRPVADALIEIWHANQYGSYSRVGDSYADDAACLLRGNVRSGAGGGYAFRTLMPGVYPGRPRHIHVRVSATGFRPLVTQIYFPPQEGVEPSLLASATKPTPSGAAGFTFDISLAPL